MVKANAKAMKSTKVVTDLVKFYNGRTTLTRKDIIGFHNTTGANTGVIFKDAKKVGRGMFSVAHLIDENVTTTASEVQETDNEIEARIRKRFKIMETMTRATANGIGKALIISGPAGLGKTCDVITALKSELVANTFTHVKGYLTAYGLYELLYNNRNEGDVTVFDDADAVFQDETSLNLIKAATDTTETRELSWLSNRAEKEDGVPNSYEFNGTIIFITNYDFDAMVERGSRLAPHFEAMMSRSHYIDLTMKTRRDYLIRIKLKVFEGNMLEDKGISPEGQKNIVKFIENNLNKLREVSLRTAIKLADLYRMNQDTWEEMATELLLRR